MRDDWKIENGTNISLYDKLAKEHGAGHRTADWGSSESQELRFRIIFEGGIGLSDRVLDVGCGVGDFFSWLNDRGFAGAYCGLDIAPETIRLARQRFPSVPFVVGDILCDNTDVEGAYDFVVASGIFAKRPKSGELYLQATVARMFALCRRGVAFNSLSSWSPDFDEHEFHADPLKTVEFCRTLTPRIVLRTDYHPRDFTIYLCKDRT